VSPSTVQRVLRRAALEQTLQAFLRVSNEQRPHQGYRLRGQTPATRFWGAVAVASKFHEALWAHKPVNTISGLDRLGIDVLDDEDDPSFGCCDLTVVAGVTKTMLISQASG